MSLATTPERIPTKAKDRILVALDVSTAREALELVNELREFVGGFKVGLQLFTAEGPDLVRELAASSRIFLDLKFHDIPNTAAKAAIEAAKLGVWMLNVHAVGGTEMMSRVVSEVGEFCDRESIMRPNLVAVTVLTSASFGTAAETERQVVHLAELAESAGMDGVVASALEAASIRRSARSNDLLIITPGIRPDGATNDDQKRVTTPRNAVANGADHLVIGRPITNAADRAAAARKIAESLMT